MAERKRMRYTTMLPVVVAILAIACGAETPDPLVSATRQLALLQGVLVEQSGCLRDAQPGRLDGPSTALVWQKDIFRVTRSGDRLTIVDLFGDNGRPKEPVIWRIGEEIRGSGGELRPPGVVDHAGEDYLERCAGPYFLVSGVR